MNENERWWQAYLAALTGMHAYGQAGESYSIEGADRAAARVADLALARWRAMGGEDERSVPRHCEGCAHEAKDAYEEPCASCISGSGRGEDRREEASMVPAADFDAQVRRRARRWEAFGRKCWDLLTARREQCEECTASDAEALAVLRFRRMQQAELDAARRELGEVREVLREVQWCGGPTDDQCPYCGCTMAAGHSNGTGLTRACKLAASLGKEQGNV